jgi:hypothetical protein
MLQQLLWLGCFINSEDGGRFREAAKQSLLLKPTIGPTEPDDGPTGMSALGFHHNPRSQ